jgi:hypothetical protein
MGSNAKNKVVVLQTYLDRLRVHVVVIRCFICMLLACTLVQCLRCEHYTITVTLLKRQAPNYSPTRRGDQAARSATCLSGVIFSTAATASRLSTIGRLSSMISPFTY